MNLEKETEECERNYRDHKTKLDKNPIRSFVFGCYSQLKKYYKMELEEINKK